MTPAQKEKVKEHLQGKLKACPMCLTNDWVLQDDPICAPVWNPPGGPPQMVPAGKMDLERVMPLIVLSCANCRLAWFYPWGMVMGGFGG